jgi:hypothetical protein
VSDAVKSIQRSQGVPLVKVLGTKRVTDWERADMSKAWIEELYQFDTEANRNGENVCHDGLGEYWWRVLGV